MFVNFVSVRIKLTLKESCHVLGSLLRWPGGRPKHDGSFMLDLTYLMAVWHISEINFPFLFLPVRAFKIVLIPVLVSRVFSDS